MHQADLGVFKLMWNWMLAALEKMFPNSITQKMEELDKRVINLQHFPGWDRFPNGIAEVKMLTASQYRTLSYVAPVVTMGLFKTDCQQAYQRYQYSGVKYKASCLINLGRIWKKVAKGFRAYQVWYKLLRKKQHTEFTLGQLEESGKHLIDAFNAYRGVACDELEKVLLLFNVS
jgi:hypothetical protein